jgi:hypothetical protein
MRYTSPPEKSTVICLGEIGPVEAKSYPGQSLVHAAPQQPAQRAKQEIAYGRRDKGSSSEHFDRQQEKR